MNIRNTSLDMYIFLLSFKMAMQNFAAAKLRTFLTILGIIIGIASVVIVLSVGSSAQNVLLDQVRQVGSNLIAILPGAAADDGPPAVVFGVISTTLTDADIEQLRNPTSFPHIVAAASYVSTSKLVRYSRESSSYEIQGASTEAFTVENINLASGRIYTEAEDVALRRVAVIGSEVAKELFDGRSALGEMIRIEKSNYRVIGVVQERGASFAGNFDETIYVPLHTAQKTIMGIDYLNFARILIDDEKNIASTEADIRTILKSRHNIPQEEDGDFSVRNIAAALDILSNVTNVMKYFLVVVASIALLVGGIGIMNMMLITLNRRVREIGLRVAIGARSRDIALQFLIESLTISTIGGAIGCLIGYGTTHLIGTIAQNFGIEWVVIDDLATYGLAMAIAAMIGVVFGIYPAWKATRISPMEALRYE